MMRSRVCCVVFFLCTFISLLCSAHPEDEFCADGDMDPMLCAQIAALDAEADLSASSAVASIDLERGLFATTWLYLKLGVEHILPFGVDHLVFLLALLVSSGRLSYLALQISLFTLAHTVALALSVFGWVALPSVLVETLIAASIVYVALENILLKRILRWRLWVVFGFGLLHGLGFAGALLELGMPKEHFLAALVGFNLGVEFAQLGVAAAVFCLLFWAIPRPWFNARIKIPISVLVATIGCWWVVERLV